MAGKGIRGLHEAMTRLNLSAGVTKSASTTFTRSMATEVPLPQITTTFKAAPKISTDAWAPLSTVPVTIHAFPTLAPRALESYSTKHLYLPLRRDLLHLAVIYEGDAHRQGTGSTKTRWEVHGSHRKVHPQKGLGRARVGTKQSPIRRGGGVYDVAWRTALSYRYRRGELLVCEDGMELPLPRDFTDLLLAGYVDEPVARQYRRKWTEQVLAANAWGRADGRTLFITADKRPLLFDSMVDAGMHGRCLEVGDVDVKDLLEEGRVVIERAALRELLESHQSDLVSKILIRGLAQSGPAIGEPIVA
ncbi:mitochondrial 54S ribosomal protein YmL6 [Verticillium alfalfae VaMs.102]|uniref:Large ribosomal subunit protein uL4m n=1 Tax=Verticillium alfalfae (strain VaMs.102 / ATCC MYA-4576 / FGSC 10136) TaxID=526221 RepID=C9SRJ8_VERA1|nr:mitochondrial 54S ribosomal protein YmL6 [Verticillium alfalfae VaMs.102]EEY21413.1 54S ribosomal protein YmL6 [Verticillium alfalfae VaMs.102]